MRRLAFGSAGAVSATLVYYNTRPHRAVVTPRESPDTPRNAVEVAAPTRRFSMKSAPPHVRGVPTREHQVAALQAGWGWAGVFVCVRARARARVCKGGVALGAR